MRQSSTMGVALAPWRNTSQPANLLGRRSRYAPAFTDSPYGEISMSVPKGASLPRAPGREAPAAAGIVEMHAFVV